MMRNAREVIVLRAGSLTIVEDAGRSGLGHLAIPPSGALDTRSWRLANRLVGNHEEAAVLETTMNGIALQVACHCVAAVTGAVAPITVDGSPAGWGIPLMLDPGQVLNVGFATAGVRSYVALSGGIDALPVFGSRSTDLLSGLGPPPLSDGDVVPLGVVHGPIPAIDFAPYPAPDNEICLPIYLGPRHDWLSEEAISSLSQKTWTVATTSNRIGLRLKGPSLTRIREEELLSEGIVTGSVQIPPDGQPVIFLADHPTTGGYPVVGVVDDEGLLLCAQARPGTLVSFRPRALPWSVPTSKRTLRPSTQRVSQFDSGGPPGNSKYKESGSPLSNVPAYPQMKESNESDY